MKAMGVPPEIGVGAIRFSLGRTATAEDVEIAGERLLNLLARVA